MHKPLQKFASGLAVITLCVPAMWLHAQQASATDAISPYQPQNIPAGVIRCWGHVFLKKIMASWERSFQKYHPAGGPAIFPIEIRQSAGGFCSPRSHREITIDEQWRCFPKSN